MRAYFESSPLKLKVDTGSTLKACLGGITNAGAAMAENLADEEGMSKRIEVLDITQFLVAHMLEWTAFDGSKRRLTFEELIARYNVIVEACETDPSLKIEVA